MTKIKVTINEVISFYNIASQILSKEQGKFSSFLYALNKVKKRAEEIVSNYNDEMEELRLNLAGKDEDGYVITTEEKGYKFTPENTIKLNKKSKNLLKKEVEIESHITTDVPEKYSFTVIDSLTPFVFEPMEEIKK